MQTLSLEWTWWYTIRFLPLVLPLNYLNHTQIKNLHNHTYEGFITLKWKIYWRFKGNSDECFKTLECSVLGTFLSLGPLKSFKTVYKKGVTGAFKMTQKSVWKHIYWEFYSSRIHKNSQVLMIIHNNIRFEFVQRQYNFCNTTFHT